MTNYIFQVYSSNLPDTALADTIKLIRACFGEGVAKPDFTKRVREKRNPVLILAQREGVVACFKPGYESSRGVFQSWLGGTHPEHRRHGLAREMLRQQHQHCLDAGYKTVLTESTNDYKGMLILNLSEGFDIIGTKWSESRGSLGILFPKSLVEPKQNTAAKSVVCR